MTRPLPLLPIWTSLSGAVVLGCACATLAGSAGAAAERHAGLARGEQATLLVGSVDPDPGRRADRLDRLTADLAKDESFTLRRLDAADTERLAGDPVGATELPLPNLVEVQAASPEAADGLARHLRDRPGLLAYPLAEGRTADRHARPAAWLAIGLALAAAGWTAHQQLRRRAPLLLRLRRVGAAPGQLVVEALAPVAASAGLGSVVGGLVAAAMLPAAVEGTGGAALLAPPLLVTATALLGALGSLRRLLAAQP